MEMIKMYLIKFVMFLGGINRLRGTYGWFAKVFSAILLCVVYYFSNSWLIAFFIAGGYWVGELICGWEHQEVWYGLMQDLVLIALGVSYVMAQ